MHPVIIKNAVGILLKKIFRVFSLWCIYIMVKDICLLAFTSPKTLM